MTARRPFIIAVIAMGIGLAAAPAIFQMFTRAPKGGQMLDEFRPFMTQEEVGAFRGFLDEIGAAEEETARTVVPALERELGSAAAVDDAYPQLTAFHERWPVVIDDMGEMLDTMSANLENFAAVDALPPFPLFPWFFVAPGVIAVALGIVGLRANASGRWLAAIAALGVGLIAAPALFQMFSRAPQGGEMINDFRSLMRAEKVTTVQGYFLTIGAAEGELRRHALPQLAASDNPPATPAIDAFVADWPHISNQMAPMIGAMADNLDNYAAVDALPPFPLFPWFFVAPGVLLIALAGLAAASERRALEAVPASLPALVVMALVATTLAGCGTNGDEAPDATSDAAPLEGVFGINAGECTDAGVSKGSWFRMVQPGGTVADGPFVINGDSPCGDTTWTPLLPGTDGGLRTGAYQPHPDPAFDEAGNGTAAAITEPQAWFAVAFAIATNETDPQTGAATSLPVIEADGDELTGDLSAWAAAWNGQHFNQGAPKPGDAERATAPTGSFDEASGAYALDWSSEIAGGPFNGFTGVWHLEGTFSS